jgi:hypothetical protein
MDIKKINMDKKKKKHPGHPQTLKSFQVNKETLPIPGEPLSKKIASVRLQVSAADALSKLSSTEKGELMREAITNALRVRGLLKV